MPPSNTREQDRVISLGPGTFSIPERLLLAHARGEVLFIAGAGISQPANLPDFRGLVRQVYQRVEGAMVASLDGVPSPISSDWAPPLSNLIADQNAELKRYAFGDYDVVLGMLERRMDEQGGGDSRVRQAVVDALGAASRRPAGIHRSLMKLSNRGEATTILTTNFDLLLERVVVRGGGKVRSLTLGGIPRPTRRRDFSGILHIHGALPLSADEPYEFVLTDRDFGEYYLRRRIVPDLIYDAARLFNLVLVGYSANDAPMRYLLNAVAADNSRFDDLKERFVFVGGDDAFDPLVIADWRARGMTPILYANANGHAALGAGLAQWAKLSAINGNARDVDIVVRRIVRRPLAVVDDYERDLVEHLFRRANTAERSRLSRIAGEVQAEPGWLDRFTTIAREQTR